MNETQDGKKHIIQKWSKNVFTYVHSTDTPYSYVFLFFPMLQDPRSKEGNRPGHWMFVRVRGQLLCSEVADDETWLDPSKSFWEDQEVRKRGEARPRLTGSVSHMGMGQNPGTLTNIQKAFEIDPPGDGKHPPKGTFGFDPQPYDHLMAAKIWQMHNTDNTFKQKVAACHWKWTN